MELTVVVREERGSLWAEVTDLPGCLASGRSLDELAEALAEAVGLYLWDLPGKLETGPAGLGESVIVVVPPPEAGAG
jgi:predicted RNase H-like HicB family nuclease